LQYPFVKVSDMNLPGNEIYLSRAVNTVDDGLLRQIRAKTYPAGTVIFPKIGGAVATNEKRILATEATFDNNVMGVIPSPLLDTKWLYYYLMSIDLMTLARATIMPSIRQSDVADLDMPLPSLDEQHRIVEYLDAVQAKVEAIRRYQEETRAEIEAMTGAVLERALRGRSFASPRMVRYNRHENMNREGGLRTMRTSVAVSATYQEVLDGVRRLSLEEQLALVADIATVLREAVRTEDEVTETAYLAESPTFQRLVEQGLKQIETLQANPFAAWLFQASGTGFGRYGWPALTCRSGSEVATALSTLLIGKSKLVICCSSTRS